VQEILADGPPETLLRQALEILQHHQLVE
jgi:hypothetical protein